MKPTLGLRANAGAFTTLVVINAFVGAMVGLERTILPALADERYGLAAPLAVLSFIAVFGLTKALANYAAGRSADRYGRRPVLLAGWLLALPVPALLAWAPSWGWILAANALLGVSQGLTWSTTVIMKIDLVGPRQRGLAMGINEFAGYVAVGVTAWATGYLAGTSGLGAEPFLMGLGIAAAGALLSLVGAHETRAHAAVEASQHHVEGPTLTASEVFARTSLHDPTLSSVSQAGLVNNLNDGMAWGLLPLWYAHHGLTLPQIGVLAALYPTLWGLLQLGAGPASDQLGRKPLLVAGMGVQAGGLLVIAISSTFGGFATGAALLGVGTALVYPTLLAAIGDVAHPSWRASAVGIYRLWRDLGYVVGALLAGAVAQALGLQAAIVVVAGLTLASGALVALRMPTPTLALAR